MADVDRRLFIGCGITDLHGLAQRSVEARRSLDQPTTRWAVLGLLVAIRLAVNVRNWPAELVEAALLAVVADPLTRSRMRLAEAEPWWDGSATNQVTHDPSVLATLEQQLDAVAGRRPILQARARAELAVEHGPLTRATVVARAVDILHQEECDGCASGETAAGPFSHVRSNA